MNTGKIKWNKLYNVNLFNCEFYILTLSSNKSDQKQVVCKTKTKIEFLVLKNINKVWYWLLKKNHHYNT